MECHLNQANGRVQELESCIIDYKAFNLSISEGVLPLGGRLHVSHCVRAALNGDLVFQCAGSYTKERVEAERIMADLAQPAQG